MQHSRNSLWPLPQESEDAGEECGSHGAIEPGGVFLDLGRISSDVAWLRAFLYAFSVKLPLLPLLAHFFGLTYAIVLNARLILFGLVGGLLVEWLEAPPRIRS